MSKFGVLLHILIVIGVIAVGSITAQATVESSPAMTRPVDVLASPEAKEILRTGMSVARRDFELAKRIYIEDGPALSTPNTDGFDRASMGELVQMFQLKEEFDPERLITEQVAPRQYLSVPLLVDGNPRGNYQIQPSKDGSWSSQFGGKLAERIEEERPFFGDLLGTNDFKIFMLQTPTHSGPWIIAYTSTKEVGSMSHSNSETPIVVSGAELRREVAERIEHERKLMESAPTGEDVIR